MGYSIFTKFAEKSHFMVLHGKLVLKLYILNVKMYEYTTYEFKYLNSNEIYLESR